MRTLLDVFDDTTGVRHTGALLNGREGVRGKVPASPREPRAPDEMREEVQVVEGLGNAWRIGHRLGGDDWVSEEGRT